MLSTTTSLDPRRRLRRLDFRSLIIIIEHNLDVIRVADCVIISAQKAAALGGSVVAIGTPKDVAEVERSYTGRYPRKEL